MKYVVFGGSGGLGRQVVDALARAKRDTILPVSSSMVDIRDVNETLGFFEKEGPFDVLIHLAGVNIDGLVHAPPAPSVVVDVNIHGSLNILAGCIPQMREQKFGRVIFISSVLATRPVRGTGVYAGTKCFMDSLMRTCALENAKYHITCNSIQLGYCQGGLTDKMPKDVLNRMLARAPLSRLGRAEEVVQTIYFMVGVEYLTGAAIPLSGGLHLC